jgi:hypothetical protein
MGRSAAEKFLRQHHWMPLLPLTICVTRRSAARLAQRAGLPARQVGAAVDQRDLSRGAIATQSSRLGSPSERPDSNIR